MNELVSKHAIKILALESEVSTIDAQIKELQVLKKEAMNDIAERREVIVAEMELDKEDDILCGKIHIYFSTSKAIEVSDVNVLPEEYIRIKTIREADKARIKSDLERGIAIPGAMQVTNRSLQIK